MTPIYQAALNRLDAVPSFRLGHYPTPVEELPRLRQALGDQAPRLLAKRDDAISFAFGGNKVRKLELVLSEALAQNADTLVTIGGVHSNHVRVTASAAARAGLKCVLVINGSRPQRLSGNALLDELSGAEVQYVGSREERVPRMREVARQLEQAGHRPYQVPLGASTPLGALGYVRAVQELAAQGHPPHAIVVAASSGGTLAGLIAGIELAGLPIRVFGVSPDDPAGQIAATAAEIVHGVALLLGLDGKEFARGQKIVVDDGFVGEGYGIPTLASREAIALAAQTEGLYLDPTYTSKAMAALIAYVRDGRFGKEETVLFWHTGGQVELVA
ncbi:MAG: D-cysteine desulfhydrase family protein [Gemmatimonadetes bacterium]|nr:D-cysteine desulfhydrase family protein [Gemmatimonadota bacterium]